MKHIEQYDESSVQNSCKCKKCGKSFIFKPDDIWWDEKGFGYSTKLTKCKKCGCINVVKHIEDYSLDVNNDERFYL